MNRRSAAILASMLASAVLASQAQAATPTISMDGDFRLRFESIDAEGASDRERSRLRARLGLKAAINDDLSFVMRLATGDGSPVSTNVTLDSGFSAKDILVDRAYVDWRINENWRLHAGKIKGPWFKPGGSSLVWDSDLNPEGAALHFTSGALFGSFGAFSVEERSSADDSLLLTGQAGWKTEVSDGDTLRAGVSYFAYTNTVGEEPFYNGSASGNSVDANNLYVNDYRLVELFAEYRTAFGDLPMTLFADLVQNTAADDEDMALAVGAKFGKAADPGSWEWSYAWHDTEADAVIATFVDSDFAGGRTDSDGHFLKGKYALRDNVKLGGTLIIAERGVSTSDPRDYNRFMIDLEFSFD